MSQENEGAIAEQSQPPVEDVSQEASAPISASEPNLEALLQTDAFKNVVNDAVARASQSKRDRATAQNSNEIAEVKGQVSEVLTQFKQLQDMGFTPEQAEWAMNNVQKQAIEREVSPAPSQGSGGQASGLDYTQVFAEAGIDANSPAAIAAAQKAGSDPVKLGIEIGRLSAQKAVQSPVTSPAGVVQTGGQTAATPQDEDALIAEMERLQSRFMNNDPDAVQRITEIRRELDGSSPMDNSAVFA